MAKWGRRKDAEQPEAAMPPPPTAPGSEIVAWRDEHGVLLAGPNDAISTLVARLESAGTAGMVSSPLVPTEALAVFATGYADGATSMQYVRHTARSTELMNQHGVISNGQGGFRSMVIGSEGIAGNLDWVPVDTGPERALAFQSAAIGLALRTAVKEVEAAVARVEDKVDRIATMLRAERLGDALGDRRTLEQLVQRLDDGHGLTTTDWSSIASLGPAITRDLEKLRAHARITIADVETGWRPRTRVEGAEDLLGDDLLAETLALIVVAEHNFSLWQRLRVEHIKRVEPEHFTASTEQARDALHEHLAQDQQLLNELRQVQERVLTPGNLDGLAMIQSRRLVKAGRRLDSLVVGFANHRVLELDELDLDAHPSLRESIRHMGDVTLGTLAPIGNAVRWRPNRSDGPEVPELGDGEPNPVLEPESDSD